MKNLIKNILKLLGFRKANVVAKYSRNIFYFILDAAGNIVFLLFSKKRAELPQNVKKILLIRLDRIGDMILSTPAFRAVRETYPGTEIHLLLKDYTRELVIKNPNINRILIYGKDSINNGYDIAFALQQGIRQNFAAFRSGAGFRAGYTGHGGEFFLTHSIRDDRSTRIRHEVESALELVALAGCRTENKQLEVSMTDKGERLAENFIRNNGLSGAAVAAIHPGSRQPYTRWKSDGFAKVADDLIKIHKLKVVMIAGFGEEQLVNEVVSKMKEKPVILSDIPLTGLVSFLKRCKVFLGNSTGTMHIAAALKIPVVSIFGSKHPLDNFKNWGPWGEENVVIAHDPGCKACHPTDCRSFECMNSVTHEEVLHAIEQML